MLGLHLSFRYCTMEISEVQWYDAGLDNDNNVMRKPITSLLRGKQKGNGSKQSIFVRWVDLHQLALEMWQSQEVQKNTNISHTSLHLATSYLQQNYIYNKIYSYAADPFFIALRVLKKASRAQSTDAAYNTSIVLVTDVPLRLMLAAQQPRSRLDQWSGMPEDDLLEFQVVLSSWQSRGAHRMPTPPRNRALLRAY